METNKNNENLETNVKDGKPKKKKILVIVIAILILIAIIIGSCFLFLGDDIINNLFPNKSESKNDETLVYEDLYGDVNCDGQINQDDLDYLYKYIVEDPNYPLSDQAMKNANVYPDDKVNLKDFNVLTNYLNKVSEYENLPYSPEEETSNSTEEETTEPSQEEQTQPSSPEVVTPPSTPEVTTPSPTPEPVTLYGDVNCDGKVDQSDWDYLYKYITEDPNYPLSDQAMKNADLNQDNKVNIKDWNALYNYLNPKTDEDESVSPEPVTLYGDVNCDGKVDQSDWDYLYKYITEDPNYPLSDQAMKNADINLDNKVNIKDWNGLYNYLNKKEGCESLPIYPSDK